MVFNKQITNLHGNDHPVMSGKLTKCLWLPLSGGNCIAVIYKTLEGYKQAV